MARGVLTAAGVAALIVMTPLAAGEAQVWYLGGEGGWTHLNSAENNRSNGTVFHEDFAEGFNVGARLGYQWGPWRFEGEFSYRRNDESRLRETVPVVVPFPNATGDRHSYAEMGNVIYDFPLGWPLTPHLGGGIGAAEVTQNVSTRVGAIHSSDTVFAYQGIAGVEWDLNPALAIDIDYRYFSMLSPHFTTVGGVGVKTANDTHNIVASLIWRFGAPPPIEAAPPAPLPLQRQVFMVFFDWDRDTITPDGIAIIQQAATAWRAGAPVRIMVTGYTDRSGSAGYNQRLSERRANNVANALAGMGVPRDQMAVGGRGENDNRIPTAAGVREPQNRRVEIVFP